MRISKYLRIYMHIGKLNFLNLQCFRYLYKILYAINQPKKMTVGIPEYVNTFSYFHIVK